MDDSMEISEPTAVQTRNEGASFDVEQYASNYTGHTKINRLLFIAEQCPSLSEEAYQLAISELKMTTNTQHYVEVCQRCVERFGTSWAPDMDWVSEVDKKAQLQLDKLELELKNYKTNFIKESSRMGHNDLGAFFYDRGDLPNALKNYIRTRDYCTTSKHHITMCLNVIKISVEMKNSLHIMNYVSKAENTAEVTSDPVVVAKLKCVNGLVQLDDKKYKLAARKFLETTIDLQSNYCDVIAPQDVTVYGGLCALATFSRDELKTKLIDNAGFRNFLELVPEVRELINDFYASRYKSCLNYLARMKSEWSLDIYLSGHVDTLFRMIREKALIQYFSPFLTVDMRVMADAFNTDLGSLEKELSTLINNSSISARIDSQNKILYARSVDKRNLTFGKAFQVGEKYLGDVKALILRMNMVSEQFMVALPNSKGGRDDGWEGDSWDSGRRQTSRGESISRRMK